MKIQKSPVNILKLYISLLCCPICKGVFSHSKTTKKEELICQSCERHYLIKEGILYLNPPLDKDLAASIQKWDEFYKQFLKSKQYVHEYQQYQRLYFQDTYDQLNVAHTLKQAIYLEIGCGRFYFGQDIASQTKLIIGVDLSKYSLMIAKKMLDQKGITNYILIFGDILRLPIKSNAIDVIYGGGVIEHFKDTQQAVDELYRVLKPGGVSFNSVPMLNLGSLSYRQIWGNIPNFPVLKQLAELIHIRLMRGKHMIFGYEFSFLPSTQRKIHQNAGFKQITIGQFRVTLTFDFLPEKLRKPFISLAMNSPLFWPMIKIVAKK